MSIELPDWEKRFTTSGPVTTFPYLRPRTAPPIDQTIIAVSRRTLKPATHTPDRLLGRTKRGGAPMDTCTDPQGHKIVSNGRNHSGMAREKCLRCGCSQNVIAK